MNADTTQPMGFYVSAIDGPKYWLLAGPYQTHAEALADVTRATHIALDAPGGEALAFARFGTCRAPADKPGRLNAAGLM